MARHVRDSNHSSRQRRTALALGFIYMLAGDTGTTNHHPHQRDTRQHWVQTGPHVMVVGPRVRDMGGYSRTMDVADPNQPYVMYPGTPYEHLMLPTK
jgi:hypothetical protein